MKPFDELTEDELIVLGCDGEKIRQYVDLMCAEEGVPLLPTLPPEPTMVFPEPECEIFGIAMGYREPEIWFLKSEDAAKVLDAMRGLPITNIDYISTPRQETDRVINASSTELKISMKVVYSIEQAKSARELLASAKREKDFYDVAKKKYDRIAADRENFVSRINEKIYEASRASNERANTRSEFARYLTLAEGNERIAWRFLTKAKPEAANILPDLREKYEGPEAVAAVEPPTTFTAADDDPEF